jgi:hypothetical protein
MDELGLTPKHWYAVVKMIQAALPDVEREHGVRIEESAGARRDFLIRRAVDASSSQRVAPKPIVAEPAGKEQSLKRPAPKPVNVVSTASDTEFPPFDKIERVGKNALAVAQSRRWMSNPKSRYVLNQALDYLRKLHEAQVKMIGRQKLSGEALNDALSRRDRTQHHLRNILAGLDPDSFHFTMEWRQFRQRILESRLLEEESVP